MLSCSILYNQYKNKAKNNFIGLKMKSLNKYSLVAPCGINCGVCSAYLRTKNRCLGCRIDFIDKQTYCINCKIKNCDFFKKGKAKFCSECKTFPCKLIKNIDKRYRTSYNTSLIKNLENIKNLGIKKFLINEKDKWTCSKCGGVISIHKGFCTNCETKKNSAILKKSKIKD
jgi:hypothetical protein